MGIFPYIGGKASKAKWIVSNFPPNYTRMGYLEPFGGALSVFLEKSPSKVEVLNDKNEDIFILWNVIKEQGPSLAREASLLPYSRKLYEEWAREWWQEGKRPSSSFERALRFFYLMHSNRSGKITYAGWNCVITRNSASPYREACRRIEYIQKRLQNAHLECVDFREVIERLDHEDCLMYVDPPYIDTHYYIDFSLEDHEDLACLLNKAKSRIILSLYPHPLVEELYPPKRWNVLKKRFFKSAPNDPEKREPATELLLLNYDPPRISLFGEER